VSLPPDVVAEGVRRLGWLGLIYSITTSVGIAGKLMIAASEGAVEAANLGVPDVFGLVAVIMGLVIYAVVRRGAMSSTRLLDAGLVFLFVGALGIAVREFWSGVPQTIGFSWFVPAECVWLVAYPLLVPNTPAKILVSSLAAASAGPAAFAVSAFIHETAFVRPLDAVIYFGSSTYLCAIMAYVIARIVHRVNVRLRDAREIGSYELIERIGQGGMGEVWRAHHRMLAQPAAIKLIRSDWLDDSLLGRDIAVRRFEREARDTASLRSIHTVHVYDFGLTEQGDFYYVMELLEGLNVDQLVRRFGPLNPARAAYLLRQVCDSLSEAHSRNLVHRDIKPANIFVCRLGLDVDFVKVLDFGLVSHNALGDTVTRLSLRGVTVGTPGYMAPEVALGRPVDDRADIYSLGCVAYYMLTGQPVFSSGSEVATALAHVQETPVPPSRRAGVDLSDAFESLILDCLAKNPAARPESAADVSARLAAAVAPDGWTRDAASVWWQLRQPLADPAANGIAARPRDERGVMRQAIKA
jgi:serine/threonine-protein kinase